MQGKKIQKQNKTKTQWCMWLLTGAEQGPDRAACRQTQKGTFTLNSTRPVSEAGSGIVAGPDRVTRGEERAEGGGGRDRGCPWGRGELPPSDGGRKCAGSVCEWGEGGILVLADFHGVQMLNMQMSNRIVRRWIGSPSWFALGQSPAVAQRSAEFPWTKWAAGCRRLWGRVNLN